MRPMDPPLEQSTTYANPLSAEPLCHSPLNRTGDVSALRNLASLRGADTYLHVSCLSGGLCETIALLQE